MKVEYSTGDAYPSQTCRAYSTGRIRRRFFSNNAWGEYINFSDDATVLSQAIKCKTFYNDTTETKQFPTPISINAVIFAFDTQNILNAAICSFNTNQGSRITYAGNSNALVESFSLGQITLTPNVCARIYDV